MSVMRTIETESCIEEGATWLAAKEPRFATVIEQTGLPPLRRREAGFRALLGAIVSQQLSVAAADSVWNKLQAAGFDSDEAVLDASTESLRGCGLSGQKVRYAKALAESGIDYTALETMSDQSVVDRLTEVTGIGRWTAEIYVMFALGRADVFAAGDLALQESARLLFELSDRPNERELAQTATAWSPWRAIAARLLWAHYRHVKDREGIRGS